MSSHRYEASQEQNHFSQLRLLYITSSKYEGDWHSTMHSHQCSEIFYVVSGHGEFHVEDAVFPVQADQLVIINSNVEHTEACVPQTSMQYIVMGVEGCNLLLENNDDRRYFTIDCASVRGEILRYMQLILEEMSTRNPHYGAVANNLLEIFFVKLLRHKSITMERASTSKSGIQCALVKRYLDNHYKENITLDTLAGITYLNKFFLAYLFKEEYGISPINYLVRRRVAESRYLLAQTDYRISEIASMLGFSSSSYFTQTFTRIEGISPRVYRKQAQASRENDTGGKEAAII